MNIPIAESLVKYIFLHIDTNKDGVITIDEFDAIYGQY